MRDREIDDLPEVVRIRLLPRRFFDDAERRDAEAVVVVLPCVVKDDEDAALRRNRRDLRANPRRQPIEARVVSGGVAHVLRAVRGIERGERVANPRDVMLRVDRIHPEMRIVALDRQAGGAIDDREVPRVGVAQHALHPRFQPRAVLDEQACIAHHRDALRRGLERFRRRADRNDARDVHVLSADALDEGVQGGDRRHDRNRPSLRRVPR